MQNMEHSKQVFIPDIIPLDSKSDHPPEGVVILDDGSDSDDHLPEGVS